MYFTILFFDMKTSALFHFTVQTNENTAHYWEGSLSYRFISLSNGYSEDNLFIIPKFNLSNSEW